MQRYRVLAKFAAHVQIAAGALKQQRVIITMYLQQHWITGKHSWTGRRCIGVATISALNAIACLAAGGLGHPTALPADRRRQRPRPARRWWRPRGRCPVQLFHQVLSARCRAESGRTRLRSKFPGPWEPGSTTRRFNRLQPNFLRNGTGNFEVVSGNFSSNREFPPAESNSEVT